MKKEVETKKLVIVESPSKSKTISQYLGNDYVVASSIGHIRDLTTKGIGGYGVDIEDNFKPMYRIMKDKGAVVKELKALVKNASKVYLATDPDREGEAISWHLYEALGLEVKEYERIVFNEVTKGAILKAIENGRDIDMDLVHSQESRRIIDRIIGFSLSKLLQKKIGSKSAGRVQSAVLKLIVEREEEIESFTPEEFWEMFYNFNKRTKSLKARLSKYLGNDIELKNEQDTIQVKKNLGPIYKVSDITEKEKARNPKPPFITSTLQQELSSKYNFNSKKTMQIAQKLYEGVDIGSKRVGLITYMRTDSIRLSNEFVDAAKKYIVDKYGNDYYEGYKQPKQNGKNIQDAHEAIRPTSLDNTPEKMKDYLTNDEYKFYTMIFDRAISSLMKPAKVLDERVTISNNGYDFYITGEKVLFDGYLKMYNKYEDDDEKALPLFKVGEEYNDGTIEANQKFTQPPARYTEAKLIKKMEDVGIGRPSTYAVTVDTLKIRNYIKIERKAIYPTEQGILTSKKLDEYFNSIINVEYTADMEKALDDISEGNMIWYKEVGNFYKEFKPLLDNAEDKMERMYPIETEELCPECGRKLLIRNGRFGEFMACSGFPKCHYTAPREEMKPKGVGMVCPVCGKGEIVERISTKGRSKGQKFYACSRYPKCKITYTSLEEVGHAPELEAKAKAKAEKADAKTKK